jgi:hypothetical protein
MKKPEFPSPEGMETWRNKKGWLICKIHYTADPEKRSVEWKQWAMDSMPDMQSFNREFEVDFTSSTGDPFYPLAYQKYVEDRGYFIREQKIPDRAVIYRGFDFGFHRPVCVWAWVDAGGVVRVLREFCPREIDVYNFRDAVRHLSGELPSIPPERARAIHWVGRVKGMGLEWFERHPYMSFSGVEAKKTQSITGDFGEMNDFEVMDGGGISLSIVNQRVSAGTYVIRNLMRDTGGQPSIQIDPSCTTLISALCGGLTFGEGTKASPLDDEVAIHPEYSHVHDALRYLVTGVINVADMNTALNRGMVPQPQLPQARNPEPPRYGPSSNQEDTSSFYATQEPW